MTNAEAPSYPSRVRGCLLGGAIGDQLGAGIEFLDLDAIRTTHGERGVTDFVPAYDRSRGAITDDTQMSLFVAEGLVRAAAGAGEGDGGETSGDLLHAQVDAHLRWLHTQGFPADEVERRGFGPVVTGSLVKEPVLHARRAPGNTCLSGILELPRDPLLPAGNGSKGCGGVMRAAPVGLARPPHEGPAGLAYDVAGITHGHPTGRVAAAVLAQIVSELCSGRGMADAIAAGATVVRKYDGYRETLDAVDVAIVLARRNADPGPEVLESVLGGGWVAEEALAIGLYCALVAERDVAAGRSAEQAFGRAALLAVNHSGDSDSTGSICGNLVGARYGETCLPAGWLADLEGRDVIERVADELAAAYASYRD